MFSRSKNEAKKKKLIEKSKSRREIKSRVCRLTTAVRVIDISITDVSHIYVYVETDAKIFIPRTDFHFVFSKAFFVIVISLFRMPIVPEQVDKDCRS